MRRARFPTQAAVAAACWLVLHAAAAVAVPLTVEELASTCGSAEGLAHCGRMVEAVQMRRLPNLAVREGDVLYVTLYPSGRASFTDSVSTSGSRSFALWDYLDPVNIAVVYATRDDDAAFVLLQRANGRAMEVPAEPKLSPDRQRLVTADVCAERCSNEIALWRISRDGVRKEAAWTPPEPWSDATARWKSPDTVVIEYTRGNGGPPYMLERRLGDPGWKRIGGS
ncbi:MAG: hypothetical protein ABI920_00855 [Casimicrobiaceae bacterium]